MHDLILLGQGPSMDNCPFDTEVWAALSVLSHKGWEDKPYSKLFLFDDPYEKADEMVGLEIALARKLSVICPHYFSINGHATEPYPQAEITKRFNSIYFMNDMSYMIALALYNGYKSLLLWGVDQGPGSLYVKARQFVTYWLGVATGMGVEWALAPNSILWRKDEVPV